MKKKFLLITTIGLLSAGAILCTLGLRKEVSYIIDGQTITTSTNAFTVAAALREAGVSLTNLDQVSPPPATLLGWGNSIKINLARPVTLFVSTNMEPVAYYSVDRYPANILQQAGILLFPGDTVFWNGEKVDPAIPLIPADEYVLQYKPAVVVTVIDNNHSKRFSTAAATLAEALWEQQIHLSASDSTSLPLDTPLLKNVSVVIGRSIPLTILADRKEIALRSAAATVGQALAAAGLSLQGMDISVPAEGQPIPADGKITVVRVREEIVLVQTPLPFKTEYVDDSEIPLDQKKETQAGEMGIQAARLRIRYEDGNEVSRSTEAQWIAKQPKNQKIASGTKVVVQTLQTPDGTIEYWRAVTVYATSYSNCNLGTGGCSDTTASGMKVGKGVIGVVRSWYNQMVGQRVYVPGYGFAVIGDIGGGVAGTYWIDVAYTDAEYVAWHQNVTLYFLTPVPASFPVVLP